MIKIGLYGYGNIARGVRAAVHTDGLLGALSGPLTAAAVGSSAALVFGYLTALIFRSKPKRL